MKSLFCTVANTLPSPSVLASILDIPPNLGYLAVFIFIAVETMGIPAPGEAVLIGASLLAAKGSLKIEWVIILAASAAIIGDNIGFVIGRHAGRRVFLARGPFQRHRILALEKGEPFFEKHGPKAVFLGRWVALLRIASAWLAGINRMSWGTFLFWNALGGIVWAAGVGLAAYYLGEAVHRIIQVVGIGAAIAFGVVAMGVVFVLWQRHRRQMAQPTKSEEEQVVMGDGE